MVQTFSKASALYGIRENAMVWQQTDILSTKAALRKTSFFSFLNFIIICFF